MKDFLKSFWNTVVNVVFDTIDKVFTGMCYGLGGTLGYITMVGWKL